MVVKNQKTVNVSRKKQGLSTIQETSRVKEKEAVIKGRSWMLPSLLIIFALLYFITSPYGEVKMDALYWFTGISYVLLGVLMYLVRRPVIKIGKAYMTVRRFSGDKLIEPKDIGELTLNNGHVVIQMKNSKKKFVYTKLQHRFPMDTLNSKLREFAVEHKVELKDETK
jgi:hypothetical protein